MAPSVAATDLLQKGAQGVPVPLVRTVAPDINIIQMDGACPRDLISLLNLSLDVDLVDDIMEFVNQPHTLGLAHPLDPISIYAIACIVAESKRLLAVDSHSLVMVGLPTERFLVRLEHEKRLPLIQRIDQLALKWPWCLRQLSRRVQAIRRGYRRFLQGRQVFGKLTTEFREPFELVLNHFKLLWLAYVQIKSGPHNYNSPQEQTTLLLSLIRTLFGGYLYDLPPETVTSALQSVFLDETRLCKEGPGASAGELDSLFLKVMGLRQGKQDHETLQLYLSDINFTNRMVDDMHKNILANHTELGFQKVNETIFLDMDWNIAPMAFTHKLPHQSQPIRNRIHFQDCFSLQQPLPAQELPADIESSPQPEAVREEEQARMETEAGKPASSSAESTPEKQSMNEEDAAYHAEAKGGLANRIQALRWVQTAMLSHEKGQENQFNLCYARIFGEQFEQLSKRYKVVLRKIILRHSPECRDIEGRCRKIMDLFMGMLKHLMNLKTQAQLQNILSQPQQLASFLFVSTILLNYVYKAPEPYSPEIIEALGIDVRQAFIPINWVGKNFNLLPCLKDFLRSVEGRILLSDLWNTHEGFMLLQNLRASNATYLDRAMQQRLKKHISWRIYAMSNGDHKLEVKIQTIVDGIREHRSILLQFNSISLIIVAAYAISSKNANRCLCCAKALTRWAEIERLVPEELVARDYNGAVITFQKFVEDIFKQEAAFIINVDKKSKNLPKSKSAVPERVLVESRHFRMGELTPFSRPVNFMAHDYRKAQTQAKASIVERINFDAELNQP